MPLICEKVLEKLPSPSPFLCSSPSTHRPSSTTARCSHCGAAKQISTLLSLLKFTATKGSSTVRSTYTTVTRCPTEEQFLKELREKEKERKRKQQKGCAVKGVRGVKCGKETRRTKETETGTEYYCGNCNKCMVTLTMNSGYSVKHLV